MLNRRMLRIKALQAVYACQQAEAALLQNMRESLAQPFERDLNSLEAYDAPRMEGLKQLAESYFDDMIAGKSVGAESEADRPAYEVARKGYKTWQDTQASERKRLRQDMLAEAEGVRSWYLMLLDLLVEMSHQAEAEEEENRRRMLNPSTAPEHELKLVNQNPFIEALKADTAFQQELKRAGVSWHEHGDFLKKLYREEFKKMEGFADYVKAFTVDTEGHRNLLLDFYKKVVFKSEVASEFFENLDLRWTENHDILRGMVVKTLKSLQPGEAVTLLDLSPDWADDRHFFLTLFDETIAHQAEWEQLIASRSQNWDTERLAMTDRILLMLAISEWTAMPNIPVKVTINEYIELAKGYSTPQSKQFVNGLLDALSEDLKASGRIIKSGRGLFDQ